MYDITITCRLRRGRRWASRTVACDIYMYAGVGVVFDLEPLL